MTIWNKIASAFPMKEDLLEASREIIEEIKKYRITRKTQTELLSLTLSQVAYILCELKGTSKKIVSPVAEEENSSWMVQSDFCFINIRATGRTVQENGTIVNATKILFAIACESIHVAPFLQYQFGVVYAGESVMQIASELVDEELSKAGFLKEDQLKAFIEACHILKKTVGFDLEPHVTQFARVVLDKPEVFRWLRINEDRDGLYNNYSQDEMLESDIQKELISEIMTIRDNEYGKIGISSFDNFDSSNIALKKKTDSAYFATIKTLIDAGYWTIPVHTWGGVGVPEFYKYNKSGNYPEFLYLTETGENQSRYAYCITTPFAFYSGLMTNRINEANDNLIENKDVVQFYADIFLYWRNNFGFDFVRYDSVDHVFDSVVDKKGKIPTSDRPTPEVLNYVVNATRRGKYNYIGAFAERMGLEIEEYASCDFDLMLGNDMLKRLDKPCVEVAFNTVMRLSEINKIRSLPFSVTYAIDTHDTGNPHFWFEPLIKIMGFERMRLRHFFSRFGSCGKGYRPKYEVMGLQDLSYGLYEANISDKSIQWVGNKAFANSYFVIEQVFCKYKKDILEGELSEYYCIDGFAYWIIRSTDKLLLCLLSLETAEGKDVQNISIDVGKFGFTSNRALEYDCKTLVPKEYMVYGQLYFEKLEFLDFRLICLE